MPGIASGFAGFIPPLFGHRIPQRQQGLRHQCCPLVLLYEISILAVGLFARKPLAGFPTKPTESIGD